MDLAWRSRALCVGADEDLFFPQTGKSARAAKAICARCPVRMRCLAEALDNGETYGVWGGLTPEERRQLKRRLKVA